VGPRTGLDTVAKRKIPSPCRDSNPHYPVKDISYKSNTCTDLIAPVNLYQFPTVVKHGLRSKLLLRRLLGQQEIYGGSSVIM
jgi:hypothetical protein